MSPAPLHFPSTPETLLEGTLRESDLHLGHSRPPQPCLPVGPVRHLKVSCDCPSVDWWRVGWILQTALAQSPPAATAGLRHSDLTPSSSLLPSQSLITGEKLIGIPLERREVGTFYQI